MNKTILDIGTGSPFNVDDIPLKNDSILHVDIEKQAYHVEVLSDIQHLAFGDNCADKVIASHIFEHLPNPTMALRECYRVLKPNGFLIIRVPNESFFRWKTSGASHIVGWNSYSLETFCHQVFKNVIVETSFRSPGSRKRKILNLLLCFFLKENEVTAVCRK